MSVDDQKPAYWAVIPADVRYDDALPPNAKLLYGEISSLCDQRGYCYATNSYFSKLYGWGTTTIRRLLSALSERGYIQVDIVRDRRTKEVEERRIYAGLQAGVTPPAKNGGRSRQKKADPPAENGFPIKEEQYEKNIPPISPQGGKRAKSIPKWKPERFERFWAYYRDHARGEDRAGASREWDRLKPDDDLIRTMGQALQAQVQSEDWRRRIGIPYACRWLRNRRWEDTPLAPAVVEDEPDVVMVEDRGLPVWST